MAYINGESVHSRSELGRRSTAGYALRVLKERKLHPDSPATTKKFFHIMRENGFLKDWSLNHAPYGHGNKVSRRLGYRFNKTFDSYDPMEWEETHWRAMMFTTPEYRPRYANGLC